MKSIIFICLSMLVLTSNAQNVGIGINDPSPYGHGGTNRLLEIHNPATAGDVQSHLILSSAGSSGSLGGITWVRTGIASGEKRTGYIGNLIEPGGGTKLSFFNKNIAGNLVERLTLNSLGYLGIGMTNPNTPLSFSSVLGKKINLYTGSQGNVGMGVYSNEFRIHTDYPNADITFGHENTAGVFTERMRIKGTGEIALVQTTGNTGQVITSNGPGQPATWSDKPSVLSFDQTDFIFVSGSSLSSAIPSLTGQQIVLTQNARLVFNTTLTLVTGDLMAPSTISTTEIRNVQNQVVASSQYRMRIHDFDWHSVTYQGVTPVLSPGVYYTRTVIGRANTSEGTVTATHGSNCGCHGGQLIIQVFPQ